MGSSPKSLGVGARDATAAIATEGVGTAEEAAGEIETGTVAAVGDAVAVTAGIAADETAIAAGVRDVRSSEDTPVRSEN